MENYKMLPLSPDPRRRGDTGAVSEMLACVDLLKRGFHVFRAISPQCACDVIAMYGRKCWRIEVRTGNISNPTNAARFPVRETDKCDAYAIVIDGKVGYLPETFIDETFPWQTTKAIIDRVTRICADPNL